LFLSTRGPTQLSTVRRFSPPWWKLLSKTIWRFKWIYLLMVAPTLALVVLFRYLPMPGIYLAFETFKPVFGKSGLYDFLLSSQFVGLQHFQRMLIEPGFWTAMGNTVIISLMKLVVGFPFPIILALMINEVMYHKYKRVIQTIYTFPHFLSWVVVAGIMLNIFGDSGAVKKVAVLFDPSLNSSWNFLYNTKYFRWLLVFLDMWKEAGWGTILYLAAIAGIDQSLYEAATVDGCGRIMRIWHITLPGIIGMVVIMFILSVGGIMNANFDQVFNLYSGPVFSVGDVIDTYIYRLSFQSSTTMDYGFTTAVGLFKTIINFALLIAANFVARKAGHDGIM
jgi:putative aldouronate transport system permease protein